MKKLMMIIGAIALFAGCRPEVVYLDKDGQPVQPPPPPDHVKVLWREDYIRCCEIEGHRYFVGMSSGNATGARTIVHAESCPCKTSVQEGCVEW